LLRKIYYRDRVFDELKLKISHSVIWVDGDAGSGKTTLINSFLESEKMNHWWYKASTSDNNLNAFLFRFSQSLHYYLPTLSKTIKTLSLPFQIDIKTVFKSLFNELHQNAPLPLYLVLDDFHFVTNSDFHEILVDIVTGFESSGIHIIIIGRHIPPEEYSRLRALQKFYRMNKSLLFWQKDEVIPLISILSDSSVANDMGELFFDITEGWVAGIILLIETLKEKPGELEDFSKIDRRYLFEYLSSEVFSKMSEVTQRVLMKASFFNEVNVKRDKKIFQESKLKPILEDLCNKNYFTNSQDDDKNIYTFHPLFKSFLQKKANVYLTEIEILMLKKNIANVLLKTGRVKQAIDIYIQISDWETAENCIAGHAEKLITEGKSHLILGWIEAFGSAYVLKHNGLKFWVATAYLPNDHNKSYELFQDVYSSFQFDKDKEGEFRAICGIFESILFSNNFCHRLTPWINLVTQNYREGHKPNRLETRARLAADMHTAMVFSQPSHPDIDVWAKKVCYLMKILKITFNDDHRVLVGANLYYHYMWRGQKSKASNILEATKVDTSKRLSNPVSQGAWYLMASLDSWMFGDAQKAKTLADTGIAVANESGILFWKNLLLAQKAYACLVRMELGEAEEILHLLAIRADLHSQVASSIYFDLHAQLNYLQGNLDTALEYHHLCMVEAVKLDMPFATLGYRLSLAEIYIARKDYDHAKEVLNITLKESEKLRSDLYRYRGYLLLTHLSLEQSNIISAKRSITIALNLAEKRGYDSHPWWNEKNISLLYEFALNENINTDYIISCIKKRKLNKYFNFIEYDNWDWPVKIYTFGECRIIINGKKLVLTGKSQRKPLALLKAIISLGAWKINQSSLAEKVWPDSDGTESMRSLKVTVHRLRKILGTETILIKDGYIGLNTDQVWIDVNLGNYYAKKISNHSKNQKKKSFYVQRLIQLYKGKFYENDQDEAWCFHYSTVVHEKIIYCLLQYVTMLKNEKKYEESLMVLNKVGQLDLLKETIYKNKIDLLILLNRKSEAISVYNECRNILSKVLHVMPSINLPVTLNSRVGVQTYDEKMIHLPDKKTKIFNLPRKNAALARLK